MKLLLIGAIVLLLGVAIMQLVKPRTTTNSNLEGLLVTTTTPGFTSTITPELTSPTPTYKSEVLIENVPFAPQAPFAQWKDSRFQDGCEEASSLMAVYWIRNLSLDKNKAQEEIIAMAAYQTEKWGEPRDTSAEDTATRLLAGYFNFNNYEVKEDMSVADIKNELLRGNLMIVPANGRALNNPHFTAPGPDRHMIVIRGYDDNTNIFITNDPGIKEGELYKYPQQLLFNAIRDYPTGYHLPIGGNQKTMIIVKKS